MKFSLLCFLLFIYLLCTFLRIKGSWMFCAYVMWQSSFSCDSLHSPGMRKVSFFCSLQWSPPEPSSTFLSLTLLPFVLYIPHQFSMSRLKVKQLRVCFSLVYGIELFSNCWPVKPYVLVTHCIIWASCLSSIIFLEEHYKPNFVKKGF